MVQHKDKSDKTAAVEKEKHMAPAPFPEYPSKEWKQATDVFLRMSWGRLGLGCEKTKEGKKRRKK